MGVNSLPKTVTRQCRDCDLNPGPSAPESSTLIAKFHYTDTDKVGARCRVRAKFHYTDPTGPARTFFAAKPLGPCGSPTKSARVRVVEFSFNHSATEPPTSQSTRVLKYPQNSSSDRGIGRYKKYRFHPLTFTC